MANPIEPPPFRTVSKRPSSTSRFSNVRGEFPINDLTLQHANGIGASMVEQAPEPASESYLRYDLGDGRGMQEFARGQEPSMGTFSMMTAPENVDRVTGTSQMEDLDLQNALNERRLQSMMMQPYQQGMQMPGRTVGEMRQRLLAQESAQDTLARLDQQFGNIESQRSQFMQDRIGQGVAPDQAKMDADNFAMRLERRALMAEQLAQGRGLPSSAFDNRYR